MTHFKITKNEKLPKSQVVIEGELTVEAVNDQRKKVLEKFQNKLSIDGFRKGHVPEKKLIEMIGELGILDECASMALEKNYADIIKQAKVFPLGAPHVSITKLAPGNPVSFKMEMAIMPEFEISDYKKCAKEVSALKEETVVEDKEIEDALLEMRRSFAHYEKHHQEGSDGQDHEEHSGKDIKEEDLPPLDDSFATKIGKFPSLEVLREKIKESILNEKKIRTREKSRLKIMDKILENLTLEVPEVLVSSELNKMTNEFKVNIEKMGIKYDEYLVHIKKTEEVLRTEWQGEAEKRSKMELVLNKISEVEDLKVTREEIEKESKPILESYKDADPLRVEIYVETMLVNEKVWRFLETV